MEVRRPDRSIVAEPQYRPTPQWTPSVHPPPRRASTATCSRGLIDDMVDRKGKEPKERAGLSNDGEWLLLWCQTPTRHNQSQPCRIRCTYQQRIWVSTSYQQFHSDGSTPPACRTGRRSVPRHSGGRIRYRRNRHSGYLSVGFARACEPRSAAFPASQKPGVTGATGW